MPEPSHDGSPAPVRVQPAQLRRTAQDLHGIGRELRADPVAAGPDLTAAASGAPGWSAAAAAVAAAEQWREWLGGQAATAVELGERIAVAAEAYQRCDADAAARGGKAAFR